LVFIFLAGFHCVVSGVPILTFMVSFRNLDILVVVKDREGRIFDSIDTVPVDWKISDTSLGSLAQPKGVLSQVLLPCLSVIFSSRMRYPVPVLVLGLCYSR
jgi:hypothetical protein